MAKRRATPEEQLGSPDLALPRVDAAAKLHERIEKGSELRGRPVRSDEELRSARDEFKRWHDYNTELLSRLFTNRSIANQYSESVGIGMFVLGHTPSLGEKVEDLHGDLDIYVNRLRSIHGRLDLYAEPPAQLPAAALDSAPAATPIVKRAAFVVHGHDEGAREATARVLTQLGVEPIILHEQANRGQTIIEKFERHANVPFAVVLLTPDDVGRAKNDANLRERARQNVWFELGFFAGKLGRDHVCALHKGAVEIPSDIQGVIYTQMDDAGAWRYSLANELHAAGIEVDLNKLRRP